MRLHTLVGAVRLRGARLWGPCPALQISEIFNNPINRSQLGPHDGDMIPVRGVHAKAPNIRTVPLAVHASWLVTVVNVATLVLVQPPWVFALCPWHQFDDERLCFASAIDADRGNIHRSSRTRVRAIRSATAEQLFQGCICYEHRWGGYVYRHHVIVRGIIHF